MYTQLYQIDYCGGLSLLSLSSFNNLFKNVGAYGLR